MKKIICSFMMAIFCWLISYTVVAAPSITMPDLFIFSSGVGGWSTEMQIFDNWSFAGQYRDSDKGDTGTSYPNGTVYISDFSGFFTDPVQASPTSYRMKLFSMVHKQKEGEVTIEGGVRYVGSAPYGLSGGEDFIFYMPGTAMSELTEECRSWIRMFLNYQEPAVLPEGFYVLYNVKDGYAFVGKNENYNGGQNNDNSNLNSQVVTYNFIMNTTYQDHKEWATITAKDQSGKVVWVYQSAAHPATELSNFALMVNDGYVYLVENGAIKLLDFFTGSVKWVNYDFQGSPAKDAYEFSSSGKLYIAGYYGPDLFVIDRDGNTVCRVNNLKPGSYWISDMWWYGGDDMRVKYSSDNTLFTFNVLDYVGRKDGIRN